MVIKQDWNDPLGFVDKDNNLTLTRARLDTLGQIENLLFSPTGKNILIESYGEGHQFVTIYSVFSLVDNHDQSKMIPSINTLDPYPCAIWNIRWIDENTLQFSSRADFSKMDKESRRGSHCKEEEEEPERTWLWHINADTFHEISSNAQ